MIKLAAPIWQLYSQVLSYTFYKGNILRHNIIAVLVISDQWLHIT